jgi:hypothetical protein
LHGPYAERTRSVVVLGVYQLETSLFEALAKILKVDRLVDRYPHDVFQSYETSLLGQEKQLLLNPLASHWTGHRLSLRAAG